MRTIQFNINDIVKIKREHAHITELPDQQHFKITKIVLKSSDPLSINDIYYIETKLGVKFSANDFELELIK